MTRREENHKETEQRIFDAALDLFCEIGYSKTTLIDIAAEASVSTRTLYKYFPTKESILRKFGTDNIVSLRKYAFSLPADMPLREKISAVMVQDYKMMFCLFDIGYVLHSARDKSGVFQKFELTNVLSTESIYRDLFRQEQERLGIEPNALATICASVVMGMYRHCTDLFRFSCKKSNDFNEARSYFEAHLEVMWDSVIKALASPLTKDQQLVVADARLFGPADV